MRWQVTDGQRKSQELGLPALVAGNLFLDSNFSAFVTKIHFGCGVQVDSVAFNLAHAMWFHVLFPKARP